MNWASAMAWLLKPQGSAPHDLLRFVGNRVKIKPIRPKIRLPRGARPKSLPLLKKELDRVFSLFIRQRDTDAHGIVRCVTCGHVMTPQEAQAGHYVPRQDLATRWEEKNVHAQCGACNGFRGGEPEKMAAYIDAYYGEGTAEHLRAQARQKFRPSRSWLEMKIAHYKRILEGSAPPHPAP